MNSALFSQFRYFLFQSQDLETVLDDMNINKRLMIPVKYRASLKLNMGTIDWIPFLPLELFDSEEYDAR